MGEEDSGELRQCSSAVREGEESGESWRILRVGESLAE